jgi:hypothetical protein
VNYTGRPKKIGKPCMIRVHGTDAWLAGVWTSRDNAKITAPDPVWHGAVVSIANSKIRHLHATEVSQ